MKFSNKKRFILQNSQKYFTKERKIGIAFSGGGSKGFVHLGVIKAFEEYGLKFDYISGTSIGSIVGAFYANGYTSQQMINIGKKIDYNNIKNSKLLPAKSMGLQSIITNEMGDINVEDLKTPFTAVSVDIKTLEECAITQGNLAKACAGSCAVPGLFVPVKFEEKLLCDGGLKNSLPADVLKKNGCDYVISVDIGGVKGMGAKSAKLLDVLSCALKILIKDTSYKGYLHSDIVIKPDVSKFSFKKTNNYLEMVEEGYRATVEVMPQILKLFEKRKLVLENKIMQALKERENNFVTDFSKSQYNEIEMVR